ncbi:MAG: hypothetical protein ACXVJL_17050 [Candidatus Angelobacter sp.]
MKSLFVVLFCCALTFAQSNPSKKGTGHSLRLSDAYAKSAFVALKAIEGDGSLPEMRNGDAYGDRHTLDKINAADAEARSKAENNVTNALNTLYTDKLINNAKRDMQETSHAIENLDANELVDCRRVTITGLLASKLSWPVTAKSCLPGNSIPS